MQQEMELRNDKQAPEEKVEDVKDLIALLVQNDAELNLIVQDRDRGKD